MSKIGAEIELFLEKKFSEFRKENKDDRHEHNNYIQWIVLSQWEKIDWVVSESREREEKIIEKLDGLYSKKWVERGAISAWIFVIFWVSAIIWNVFEEKITIILEWFLK